MGQTDSAGAGEGATVNADQFLGASLGVAACLILFIAMLIGFALGESSVISDCDDFGVFVAGDVKYICERAQQ